jgi:hypothetical protein
MYVLAVKTNPVLFPASFPASISFCCCLRCSALLGRHQHQTLELQMVKQLSTSQRLTPYLVLSNMHVALGVCICITKVCKVRCAPAANGDKAVGYKGQGGEVP